MRHTARFFAAFLISSIYGFAGAEAAPSHCFALYGSCKYPANFTHVEYVNMNAPKGGTVKLAETGTFDSLNPYTLKGVKAPGLGQVFESLMISTQDEPETIYGWVAETIDVAADKKSVSFTLRPQARFHDGSKMTAEDVVFSFDTLKTKGDPTYQILYAPIEKVAVTGPGKVTFTFKDATNRELPLIAGSVPVLSKKYFEKHAFDGEGLEPLLGSGPYKIKSVDAGRAIIFERVKDWWGKDLPINRGQYNFDIIRYDMYRDENVTLEAFKAGEYDFRREYIARNWATAYDSPALKDGRFIKREVPDKTPQGMQAFIFNARKLKFADRRVREAIDLAMDFEWLNKTIFYGAYKRNTSFFGNTPFAAIELPDAAEKKLLEPFTDILPPHIFDEKFQVSHTDGSGNNRANLLKAQDLLNAAGWVVKDGKRVNAKTGEPLSIEFMLRQPTMERVIGPMRKNLERLGITSSIRQVDDAQYQKRTDSFDFDMVSIWVNKNVQFPGNEQMSLWHSAQADVKGSNNLSGLKSSAIDAVLAKLISAKDLPDLITAGRTLDRILLFEHVVIPNWQSGSFRIAHWDKFGYPAIPPLYNLGFQAWWVK